MFLFCFLGSVNLLLILFVLCVLSVWFYLVLVGSVWFCLIPFGLVGSVCPVCSICFIHGLSGSILCYVVAFFPLFSVVLFDPLFCSTCFFWLICPVCHLRFNVRYSFLFASMSSTCSIRSYLTLFDSTSVLLFCTLRYYVVYVGSICSVC